jgi:hypothetical protein
MASYSSKLVLAIFHTKNKYGVNPLDSTKLLFLLNIQMINSTIHTATTNVRNSVTMINTVNAFGSVGVSSKFNEHGSLDILPGMSVGATVVVGG